VPPRLVPHISRPCSSSLRALLFRRCVSAKAAIIHKGQMEIARTAAAVSVMLASTEHRRSRPLLSKNLAPVARPSHRRRGFYLLAAKLCDPNARAAPKRRHVVLGVGCRSVPKSYRSFHRRTLPVDANWSGL
jgi:hypothetical protein